MEGFAEEWNLLLQMEGFMLFTMLLKLNVQQDTSTSVRSGMLGWGPAHCSNLYQMCLQGIVQTSQVRPHQAQETISLWTLLCAQGLLYHAGTEKDLP